MSEDVYGADDDATDRVFHALASRARRRMLDLIRARPGCIVAGVAEVFEMSRIGVMKHLQVLEDAGLVVSMKEGRERRLYANAAPIQMIYERWTTELDRYWAGTLTGLKRAVENNSSTVRKGNHAWNRQAKKVFSIFIKGKIARVWEELTKTDGPQGAVYNSVMHRTHAGPGAAFQMRSIDGRYTMVLGEILEWEPPNRFAHTFRFAMYQDAPCIVRYELVERDDGVDVTMTLERLPLGTKTAKDMLQGGDFILGNLKTLIETGRLPLKTRMMYAMFARMGFMLPKKLRSEHWPLEAKSPKTGPGDVS